MLEVIHAFICLHRSHDVRRLRDHDSAFEVAGPSVKTALESGLSMFARGDAAVGTLQLLYLKGLELVKLAVDSICDRVIWGQVNDALTETGIATFHTN